ncbi:hypothetical protein XELAEV_18033039mg [Xenopus laevis]|uniref:Uncharacterized protein n=1 Tax=Xenopus laevis TaxID=8355 RepID=A0A974HDM7_XENLA|nr:hypothetical protein XELAEV_18033039mg [Xenopus laevis]
MCVRPGFPSPLRVCQSGPRLRGKRPRLLRHNPLIAAIRKGRQRARPPSLLLLQQPPRPFYPPPSHPLQPLPFLLLSTATNKYCH